MYTLEEFLSLYQELIRVKHARVDTNVEKQRIYYADMESRMTANLCTYGEHLAELNPNDRTMICTIYAAIPLQAPRIYRKLSDELKNDKLVTMLALHKFDESAYGRVGATLRGDKETMMELAKQTSGVAAISQFGPSLLNNVSFWAELIGDIDIFHLITDEDKNHFIYDVNRLNEARGLGIDMGTVIMGRQKADARSERFYSSPYKIMSIYDNWMNDPYIVHAIAEGDIEAIEKHTRGLLKKELLEDAQAKRQQRARALIDEMLEDAEDNNIETLEETPYTM